MAAERSQHASAVDRRRFNIGCNGNPVFGEIFRRNPRDQRGQFGPGLEGRGLAGDSAYLFHNLIEGQHRITVGGDGAPKPGGRTRKAVEAYRGYLRGFASRRSANGPWDPSRCDLWGSSLTFGSGVGILGVDLHPVYRGELALKYKRSR